MPLRSKRCWPDLPRALGGVLLGASFVLSLGGCTGGQSGTESEGGRFDDNPFMIQLAGFCGCALAYGGTAVRAEIDAHDGCGTQATVREVLGRSPLAEGPRLAIGDAIGGMPLWPCAEGLTLASGDEVLIVHVPGAEATDGCPERLNCSAGCPAPTLLDDGGIDEAANDAYERCALRCEIDTADACAAHAGYAQLHGQLLIAPWADPLRISSAEGEAVSLPRSQLTVLLDAVECEPTLYPDAGAPGSAVGGGPAAADVMPFDVDAGIGVEGAPSCEPE
jgi:hypothetical protein